MATVKKHGKCWQLIAYLGYDKTGKQIREFMTIPAPVQRRQGNLIEVDFTK